MILIDDGIATGATMRAAVAALKQRKPNRIIVAVPTAAVDACAIRALPATAAAGRRIRLLAEGRLVNLAAVEGHPATVMDMSFANQAFCIAHLWAKRGQLDNTVHPVPTAIDQEIAAMKLASMGISIDSLSEEQLGYLKSWREGT